MAKSAVSLTPTREDFESLLAESYSDNPATEGSVVKGRIVSIENDFAIIDVGLKTEGKIAVKEFAQPGKTSEVKVGDTVEVYLERIENAMGEAVLSRDKATPRRSLDPPRADGQQERARRWRDLRPRQGRLHRRPRRRRGLPSR